MKMIKLNKTSNDNLSFKEIIILKTMIKSNYILIINF